MEMQKESDKNLMVVSAVEGYAMNHNMATGEVCHLFKKYGVMNIIRSQYDALHTQDLSEAVNFAEDFLARRKSDEQ